MNLICCILEVGVEVVNATSFAAKAALKLSEFLFWKSVGLVPRPYPNTHTKF